MYSTWNIVDLHIHTDMSKLTKENDYEGDFSIDLLCNKVREQEVKLIALTDHNIINCDAYEELSKRDIEYLVGIELDVSISQEHLVDYVNNLKSKSDIKINIKPFHALILFRTKNHIKISNQLEKMYLDISTKLLNKNVDLSMEKYYRVTTIDYIVRHFNDEDFFIIAHGNKDKGIVVPYIKANKIDEAQNEILIGGISALEMKSNANMESVINHYNEDFHKLMNDDFRTTKTTSYVVFSDNHNCSEYSPRLKKTWIKGQPTYESLRLAFSDPESRIHTSEHEPRINTNYIDEVNICVNDGATQVIKFSPQLNVIIGGRSSGKSLLFNTLINMNNEFPDIDKHVFRKNYSSLVNQSLTMAKLSVGKLSNTLSIAGESFCQEAIIKLFEDGSDLKSKLENEFIDISDGEIRTIENDLDDIVDEFINSYKEYFEIVSKIDKGDICEHVEIVLRNSNKLFEIDIDSIELSTDLTDYISLITNLDKTQNSLIEIINAVIKGNEIFSKLEIEQINKTVLIIGEKAKEIKKKKDNELVRIKFINDVRNIIRNYVSNELTTEKQIIEQAKHKLQDDLNDYYKFYSSKLKLKKVCEKIEKIDKRIDDKVKIKSKYKFITKVNLNVNGKKIISDFFVEKIVNYSSNSSLYYNMLNLGQVEFEDVRIKQFPLDGKNPERLKTVFTNYIKNIKSKKTYEIVECVDIDHEISTLSTSQGKKASIFLDIKLKNLVEDNSKNVLFIDQLEDNIDNKYISEELVKIIRQLKRKIQVILVTHNPSIAIYGDAENIIIAESIGKNITYKQGGLENIGIREEACKILDGGEVAFKNRMDKYNIAVLNEEVK